jgi:hypothetical protein
VETAEIRESFHRLRRRTILGGNALLEKLPQQARDAGVLTRSLDSSPLSDVFLKGYSYIA